MASFTSSSPLAATAAADRDIDASGSASLFYKSGGSIVYDDGVSIDDLGDDGDALAVLLEQFALDEPCMAPLRLDRDQLRAVARPWTAALLHDAHLCVLARLVEKQVDDGGVGSAEFPSERGRIVGAAFNFHCEPGHVDDGDGWLGHFYPLPELRAHERFVISLAQRADVCLRYGDRGDDCIASVVPVPAFAIGVLVCANDQRGRGIAGGLVRRSLELAERRGYRLATATATSAYSQRAFERSGFERVLESSYAELPNAPLYSDEHRCLHRSVVVYARRLLAVKAGAGTHDDGARPSN